MKLSAWLAAAALMLSVAAAVSPAPAAEPGRHAWDAETEEQLQRLDSALDELRAPGFDHYPEQRASRGERLNQAFVALTGEAINPLFGVTALGMYRYLTTPEELREALPLYDRPTVWVPLLCVILLMLFNSTLCEAMPFLKIPLNALGDIVNKAGAVAVLPLVVKMFADQFAVVAAPEFASLGISSAFAGELSAAGLAASNLGWLAGVVVGFLIYGAVWLTFNVIDVLIIICPFPGVDALLKSFRLSVIGILTGANHLSPTAAFILAAAVTLVSLLIAGWSFRLSVFGLIFSTDILFFRRRDIDPAATRAFSCARLKEKHNLPMRTWGTLAKNDAGGIVFSYRPWLVLGRREIALGAPGDFAAGRGLLHPFLVAGQDGEWLRLPPRYRGKETALAAEFGLREIVDCGIGGAFRTWLGEIFGSKRGAQ